MRYPPFALVAVLALVSGQPAWGTCEPADFDGNGSVGVSDLLAPSLVAGNCIYAAKRVG